MNFIFLFFLFLTNEIYAAGMSSHCALMQLGNLKIGQSYSLQTLLGFPFSATYKGRAPADVYIEVKRPSTSTPDGFEPIPDINWVKVVKDKFSVEPNETVETDIIVNIPDDEKYLGKKYFVNFRVASGPPKDNIIDLIAFSAGIICSLQFSIAPKPPTEEELHQLEKQKLKGGFSVLVSPDRIILYKVPLGKKINVKKDFGETLKIVNLTEENIVVNIESVEISKSGMFPSPGYTETPDKDFISIGIKKIKLKPDMIKEIPIYIEIPDREEHQKKKYFFVIKSEIIGENIHVNYLTKIYVNTL